MFGRTQLNSTPFWCPPLWINARLTGRHHNSRRSLTWVSADCLGGRSGPLSSRLLAPTDRCFLHLPAPKPALPPFSMADCGSHTMVLPGSPWIAACFFQPLNAHSSTTTIPELPSTSGKLLLKLALLDAYLALPSKALLLQDGRKRRGAGGSQKDILSSQRHTLLKLRQAILGAERRGYLLNVGSFA